MPEPILWAFQPLEKKVEMVPQSPQVITLTPAPAVDQTYELLELTPGAVHRAIAVHSELAGKGVNVSRGLALAGIPSLAVLPMSRTEVAYYEGDSVLCPVATESRVRINVTILEQGGHTTKINQPPPALSIQEWQGLVDRAISLATEHDSGLILLAGTIPLNHDGSALELPRLFDEADRAGLRVGLDTSGEALRDSVRAGRPFFVKPNASELAECVGRSLVTLGDVIDAAKDLTQWGVSQVLVSMGPDGMLGVSDGTIVHAFSAPVTVLNTIGAGDASVAGFLAHSLSHPDDFPGSVATAVSWGAQKVQEVSSHLQSLEDLPPVEIDVSPNRLLALAEPGLL
jgi:1-phosphofructokinase